MFQETFKTTGYIGTHVFLDRETQQVCSSLDQLNTLSALFTPHTDLSQSQGCSRSRRRLQENTLHVLFFPLRGFSELASPTTTSPQHKSTEGIRYSNVMCTARAKSKEAT